MTEQLNQEIFEQVKDLKFTDIKDFYYLLSVMSPKTTLKNDLQRVKWIAIYYEAEGLADTGARDIANYIYDYRAPQTEQEVVDLLNESAELNDDEDSFEDNLKYFINWLYEFGYTKEFEYND